MGGTHADPCLNTMELVLRLFTSFSLEEPGNIYKKIGGCDDREERKHVR